MHRLLFAVAVAAALNGADAAYDSARNKLDQIELLAIPRGASVHFSPQEISAWVKNRVPEIVPDGIRDPRVQLGTDAGSATAFLDLLKMRHGKGRETNFLLARLIEGERPVKIAIRLQSGGGRCTVFLTRVEISNVVASGSVLEVLIKNFFLPLYPDAHINEPFDLGYNIDRIDIRPTGVRVTIKR
jgi:hypothetical protein